MRCSRPFARFPLNFSLLTTWLSLLPAIDALGMTDTITWGGSNDRTSYQSNHNMVPAIVGSPQFGLLFKTLLPGTYRLNGQDVPEQIFSLPLVYTGSDEIQYVYIATTQNNAYKMNAKTGIVVASRNLHRPFLVSDLDGCTDINPLIGVTATGVIDPATDIWYFTAKTYVDQTLTGAVGKPNGRYYIHAISTSDLSERPNYPVGIEGLISRNNPLRSFGAGIHHQRPGLLQYGQYVYAGFASHCAQYNFSGWIIGWDKGSGKIVEQFTTQGAGVPASVPGAGVWMSGGGLSTDGKGSMFFATGNGYASQLNGIPVNGRSPPTALEEAAVHMAINDDGTLSIVDFFMPWEKTQLDGADKDLGTTPLELLPSQFQCGSITRMGVVTGKSGKTYILNMDDLGGYSNGPNKQDKVIQVIQNENSVYSGAGVYPLEGGYIYISVIQYPTHVFKFSCNGGVASFDKVADSPEKNAYILGTGHGTTTSLNDQPGTGLLWVSDVEGSNLRIYNPVPNNGQLSLLNSFVTPGVTKFTRPVFGDGIAYQVTTTGYIYAYGSPVNLPFNCTSLQFGSVNINATSSPMPVQCQANAALTVTAASLSGNPNFIISSLPTLPCQVSQGQNFSFQAKFAPQAVGPLSSSVILNTTQQIQGYAINTPVQLKGTGQSQAPLLAVAPNTVTFNGVITGQNVGGVNQSVTITNAGNNALQITGIQYSTIGEKGPWTTANGTQSARYVSAFTFYNLPTTIAANAGVNVPINFNPSASGNHAVFVQVTSNGGSKIFNVLGSGSDVPRALLEFESPIGGWVRYDNSTPFSFGNVTENTSRDLRLRLTNIGSINAAPISLTVSKPPFGIPGSIIGASNQVDLGEGPLVYANQSVTAMMYCSVPKSQINVDPYVGTAKWTINLNDLAFGKQQLHFICNAVSEQAPPLNSVSQLGIYRYAGCFKENNPGRQLQTQVYSSDANTNDKCIAQCAAAGYIFAGTQYNSQCWCGYNRPKTATPEANCNFPCKGDVNEVCGGNGVDASGAYISTFGDITRWNGNSTDAPGPYVNPGAFGYRSLGCFTEGSGTRALSIGAQGNKTVASCLKACQGYAYAGIEYGGECYCDNKLGSGSVSASAADCSMACNNNQTEYCGGPSRLNMYVFGNGTIPSASTTMPASTTTTVSGTITTPAGPSIPPTIGRFSYLSCYTEAKNGRGLGDFAQADDSMSLTKCASLCPSFQYFGVEYGRECYCGSKLGAGSVPATDGRCNMPCAGNANQVCGGPDGLQMYMVSSNGSSTTSSASTSLASSISSTAHIITSTPSTSNMTTSTASSSSSAVATTTSVAPTGPTIVPQVANFKYLNCYTEATNSRALTDKALVSSDMTVGYCAGNCTGFVYMAIEYAAECYCGNSLMAGSVLATDGRCSMICSGNSGQICGGPNGLSLYQISASNATSSMTSSSSTTMTSPTTLSSSSTGISAPATTLLSTSSVTTSRSSSNSSTTQSSNSTWSSTTSSSTSSSSSPATSSSIVNNTSTSTLQSTTMVTITSTSRSSTSLSSSPVAFSATNSNSSTLSQTSSTSSSATTSTIFSALTTTLATFSSSRTTLSTSTFSSSTTSTRMASASPWQYLSCYADTNPRLLSSASTSSNTMTPATCQSFCLSRNFPIAGLEYSRECYCGSSLPSTTTPGQSGCSLACSGNASEICGGASRLSVYNYTLYSPPQHKPAIAGYGFRGCYSDVGPRALNGFSVSSANMTQETCVDACSTRGYKYAGAEYASQCFCGDSINASNDGKGGVKVGDGECNMLCAGDKGEWCGAGSRLSVWMRG